SPRWAALLIAPLLVAGLAACSNSDETPAEQASPSTVTETVTETASHEQDSGDAEDQDDKSQDAVSNAQDLRVTTEGQGVLLLRLDNESSVNDDSKTLEGKLIPVPADASQFNQAAVLKCSYLMRTPNSVSTRHA